MHTILRHIPLVSVMIACASPSPGAPELASIEPAEVELASRSAGMVRIGFPDPDPGIPSYLRLTTLYDQFFRTDGWLAVPIYRSPECIPVDFNLLDAFHFPTEDDPGAFGCELKIQGAYLTEADAPRGTFPRIVHSRGDDVPFWFVRWGEFQPLRATGRVTIAELAALPSLLRGTATRFEEVLRPRDGEHHVVIDAQGVLQDGRRFRFHVTHVEDHTRSIRISFQ